MDLLYLPHGQFGHKAYKYALSLVNVASCYKAAKPLKSKSADETAKAFAASTKKRQLTWPSTLMVDDGYECKGTVRMLTSNHSVESFNHWLAERTFHGQVQELESGRKKRKWVRNLQVVVADMNLAPQMRLTGLAPLQAISLQRVDLVVGLCCYQRGRSQAKARHKCLSFEPSRCFMYM